MKRLGLLLIVAALSGCFYERPERGIVAAFRSLLRAVERGDAAEAEGVAPFLSALEAGQREAVMRSLRSLAGEKLDLAVSRGSEGTWLLRVARTGSAALLVPFQRDDSGRWRMSPMVEQTQHIDIVPARRP